MASPAPIDRIVDQHWLDHTAEAVAPVVRRALQASGPQVANALHGVGLGHPLHPVLTDVPIGAWTTAVVLDLAEGAGRPEYGPGADAAIAVGLVGALGAAVTGLADWSETDGRARRTGLLHGLLNVAATTLFASAWMARRSDRSTGRTLARVGYGVSLAAAYLGGNLVFTRQIGVDHTAGQTLPAEFVPVMRADDLPEQQMRRVEVEGVKVLLVKQHGRIHAMAETCAHLGGPLSEGTLEEGAVVCPWHGSRYALEDGALLDGPSAHPQPCFEVRVSDAGMIELRTPERGL
jgi:nitrite reductase/ring-hydroxylating ferredoxin subunit/uncharacterized membrane protein